MAKEMPKAACIANFALETRKHGAVGLAKAGRAGYCCNAAVTVTAKYHADRGCLLNYGVELTGF